MFDKLLNNIIFLWMFLTLGFNNSKICNSISLVRGIDLAPKDNKVDDRFLSL